MVSGSTSPRGTIQRELHNVLYYHWKCNVILVPSCILHILSSYSDVAVGLHCRVDVLIPVDTIHCIVHAINASVHYVS